MKSRFPLFALLPLLAAIVPSGATTVSYNTGSLGAAANGTNADPVTFGGGVVSTGGDLSANYNGVSGTNTIISFQPGLNPAASSPFTIEFWANPISSDNDDSPVSNRVASGNRSGWVFFQRASGWNFRMYNGVGSGLGWDLTGGTSDIGSWSYVAATWDGTAAQLFVNGFLVDDTNDPAATGVYNSSASANLIVGSTDTGSPYAGAVDEVAFYSRVLSSAEILNRYNTGTNSIPGAYHSLVQGSGALLQLTNNVPEPSAFGLLGLGALALGRRRR